MNTKNLITLSEAMKVEAESRTRPCNQDAYEVYAATKLEKGSADIILYGPDMVRLVIYDEECDETFATNPDSFDSIDKKELKSVGLDMDNADWVPLTPDFYLRVLYECQNEKDKSILESIELLKKEESKILDREILSKMSCY